MKKYLKCCLSVHLQSIGTYFLDTPHIINVLQICYFVFGPHSALLCLVKLWFSFRKLALADAEQDKKTSVETNLPVQPAEVLNM
jgi:hypothetical protein